MGERPSDVLARAFVGAAKAETLYKDFSELREAIRAHDAAATEIAWDRCERWVSSIQVVRD